MTIMDEEERTGNQCSAKNSCYESESITVMVRTWSMLRRGSLVFKQSPTGI